MGAKMPTVIESDRLMKIVYLRRRTFVSDMDMVELCMAVPFAWNSDTTSGT